MAADMQQKVCTIAYSMLEACVHLCIDFRFDVHDVA